jgi:TonB-dependent SusC/RagA subfamily outer membrane receptor
MIPETSARIKMLKDSADDVQEELERTEVQIQITQEVIEVLRTNRDIKGTQSGLSVAELMRLVAYYKEKSTELQIEMANEKTKRKKLSEQLLRIRSQIKEEESRNTRTAGELHLQLSVAMAGKYDITVSYLTPNAWWTPYYDIRVDDIRSPLKLIYKAKVAQTTGLDWKKVHMTLSTSQPSQWGSAPVLQTWFLSYINPVVRMERRMKKDNLDVAQALEGSVPGVNVDREQAVKIRGYMSLEQSSQPVFIVNGAIMSQADVNKIDAASIQSINVLKGAEATSLYGAQASNGAVVITLKKGLDDYVSVTENQLSISYEIDLPYDVPTTGKEQTATLKEQSVPSFYKYYSVPRLDKDAYLLADVAGWEQLNLLPGEANIILNGTYVGKSFIDPASISDTLNLTLGRDKRVVVKREKLADFSSVKFLGNNKVQKLTYEITVRNNKKDSVMISLKDQFPMSTNKDIEVELLENGGAGVDTETGVLAWRLQLAPGAVKKIRFSYSVKYPKDKLVNLN